MSKLTREQEQRIGAKFFNDPDWGLVEEMINEYIEPLRDISTIDLDRGADAVMADVAGRQKAYDGMVSFLRDCRILRKISITNNTSMK